MTTTDWIGSAAATLTTTAFIPQAWKVWRTRHTADISLGMYILFTLGVALWLSYGILLESWPIIIANCVTLFLAGIVLVLKMQFG
ncbi:MAG: SemiSWEET transporter [Gallionella sp.]|jgi:MtN3 and saliva related transmembrane protein